MLLALGLGLALASCRQAPEVPRFPKAQRDVAPIVSDSFSTEDARDRVGEAEQVAELADVREGMWVADVGAGEGYYTIRLSPLVGAHGRVLAEDVVQQTTNRLADRVQRERLDNVAVRLGTPDDPKLPPHSFDRIFLVQVYHEVSSPYAFLWHLREGLKPGGQVIVVESNRPVKRHGMPPTMLRCEFGAVGMDLKQLVPLTNGETYFAAFEATRPRPKPDEIKACKS
jgi:predicted methyltransferase